MIVVATDSVHASAAAADYLPTRTVEGLLVVAYGNDRDAADALNAARVRLAGIDATVDTETVADGSEERIAVAILDRARSAGAVEIVIGRESDGEGGGDGDDGPHVASDSVVCELVATADRPVVVLPAAPDT